MTQTAEKLILLVEDDELSAVSLKLYIQKRGFRVEHERRGDRAVERILSLQPDVVVLDCNLPGKDGFDICREVRSRYGGSILMLTARTEDVEQVLGLGLGADGYLLKPATPHLVLAHITACMRRTHNTPEAEPDDHRFGQFSISRTTRTVRLGGNEVFFSTVEFDLLWLLASRAGNVLSRDDITIGLRGVEYDGINRSIDMRVSRLRKVLGDDAENPVRIKTVRGKGYLFSRTDWD
jgi:two-component system OmpR family response regulator/two-component system response regulator RstA